MRIAIMQPGYLPWLGFFDLMYNCDLFVIFDDVQYTKKDWRNRNKIRTKDGWMWLTVPVLTKNKQYQLINEVKINYGIDWVRKHIKAVEINYQRAKFFRHYFHNFQKIVSYRYEYLVDLDLELIRWLCYELGIKRRVIKSSTLKTNGKREIKIIEICKKIGANRLYDSKAAASFLDIELFRKEGIEVEFQNYNHPVYEHVYKPFLPYMSALDLLLNCGPTSLNVILGQSEFISINYIYK